MQGSSEIGEQISLQRLAPYFPTLSYTGHELEEEFKSRWSEIEDHVLDIRLERKKYQIDGLFIDVLLQSLDCFEDQTGKPLFPPPNGNALHHLLALLLEHPTKKLQARCIIFYLILLQEQHTNDEATSSIQPDTSFISNHWMSDASIFENSFVLNSTTMNQSMRESSQEKAYPLATVFAYEFLLPAGFTLFTQALYLLDNNRFAAALPSLISSYVIPDFTDLIIETLTKCAGQDSSRLVSSFWHYACMDGSEPWIQQSIQSEAVIGYLIDAWITQDGENGIVDVFRIIRNLGKPNLNPEELDWDSMNLDDDDAPVKVVSPDLEDIKGIRRRLLGRTVGRALGDNSAKVPYLRHLTDIQNMPFFPEEQEYIAQYILNPTPIPSYNSKATTGLSLTQREMAVDLWIVRLIAHSQIDKAVEFAEKAKTRQLINSNGPNSPQQINAAERMRQSRQDLLARVSSTVAAPQFVIGEAYTQTPALESVPTMEIEQSTPRKTPVINFKSYDGIIGTPAGSRTKSPIRVTTEHISQVMTPQSRIAKRPTPAPTPIRHMAPQTPSAAQTAQVTPEVANLDRSFFTVTSVKGLGTASLSFTADVNMADVDSDVSMTLSSPPQTPIKLSTPQKASARSATPESSPQKPIIGEFPDGPSVSGKRSTFIGRKKSEELRGGDKKRAVSEECEPRPTSSVRVSSSLVRQEANKQPTSPSKDFEIPGAYSFDQVSGEEDSSTPVVETRQVATKKPTRIARSTRKTTTVKTGAEPSESKRTVLDAPLFPKRVTRSSIAAAPVSEVGGGGEELSKPKRTVKKRAFKPVEVVEDKEGPAMRTRQSRRNK